MAQSKSEGFRTKEASGVVLLLKPKAQEPVGPLGQVQESKCQRAWSSDVQGQGKKSDHADRERESTGTLSFFQLGVLSGPPSDNVPNRVTLTDPPGEAQSFYPKAEPPKLLSLPTED